MTALARELAARIQRDGPLSVADFMDQCLSHPEHGYYMTRDPLGRAGDFTTSPEISQMFGELLGLWCVDVWAKLGAPDPFILAELGPGRGTLMADALRASALVPEFRRAAHIALVEMSPVLRAEQEKRVSGAHWYESFEALPEGPLILIANEFFDALPVRQFLRTGTDWRERCITLIPHKTESAPAFQFSLSPRPADPQLLPESVRRAGDGTIVEICPAGLEIAAGIGHRFTTAPGAALIIDYGHLKSAGGDTLQALVRHKFADPLQDPGTADITAHVDFDFLGEAAGDATRYGPVEQGVFLKALGIEARADILKSHATDAQADDIQAALERLTDKQTMGSLFKVMGLTTPGLPPPAGF